MTPLTRPRGRLPARVYWFRRGLVLVLAAVLILGMARLVASFAGGGDSAQTASAKPSTSTSPVPSVTPTAVGTRTPSASTPSAKVSVPATMTNPALSASTGKCKDGEVTVQPTPGTVSGGGPVTIPLTLIAKNRTCTWTVSPRTLALKITSGTDRIWSSQDCPAAIPRQSVIVRPAAEPATAIRVVWNGRRSTEDCAGGQAWAKAGDYHAIASSLGGAPTDQQFRLGVPPRPVVTKTAKPKATPTRAKVTRTPAG